MIAIVRAVVNDYGKGGTAPDPIEWCAAAISRRRRVVEAVREFALLPRPEGYLGWGVAGMAHHRGFCLRCQVLAFLGRFVG